MLEAFKRTKDDWCGSFGSKDDPLVEISLNYDPDGDWSICAEGNDDLLIQRYGEYEYLLSEFHGLLKKDYVNFEDIWRIGYDESSWRNRS